MLRKRGFGEKPTLTSFMPPLLPDKGVSSLPLLQMVAASASLKILGSMGSKPPGIRASTTTSDWSSGLVTCRVQKQRCHTNVRADCVLLGMCTQLSSAAWREQYRAGQVIILTTVNCCAAANEAACMVSVQAS
jgi:hypothetical protein